MNNKGFTLTEVIGVVVILALLALLVIPVFERALNEYRYDAYDNQIRNIKMSARNYYTDKLAAVSLRDESTLIITLGQLKLEGYIEPNIINPVERAPFSDETIIKLYKTDELVTVEIYDSEIDSVLLLTDPPYVRLYGEAVTSICYGSTYSELGVFAKDQNDNIISDYETLYFNSDNEHININGIDDYGVYYVSYSVEASGNVRKIIRTILVDHC